MKSYLRILILCLSAGFLIACGGGGSDSGSDSGSATQTGTFVDAAVEGLTYTSGSLTGETDALGTFSYETGQPVTFSVGGITIGTVSGSAIITPVQLVTGAINETDPTVINIVQFMLTIDDDHDPSNGIQVTAAIHDAAVGLSLDFTAADFDTSSSSVIDTLTTASTVGSIVLVSGADAGDHLRGSLFSLIAGSYSGTYSGTDSGNWTITTDVNGVVSGSGNSTVEVFPFNITGTITSSGSTTASAGGAAGSSTWSGIVDITTGTLSGTWTDSVSENGTFSGNKL